MKVKYVLVGFVGIAENRVAKARRLSLTVDHMMVNNPYNIAGEFMAGFAGATAVYFIVTARFLPETKGKTLEEIEASFEHRRAQGAGRG